MRAFKWLVLSLVSCSILQSPVTTRAETHWPRFRGPDGSGHCLGEALPVRWGPKDVVWRTALEGQGQSSPCVWGTQVFLTSARKTEDGQVARLLGCVHGATGEVVWQQTASVGKAEVTHRMNGFASATCASDGRRVAAFFGQGGLHCYDLEGTKLWSRDLGPFAGPWGSAASPIILDGKVIQNCDTEGESFLIALDLEDGQTIWKASRGTMPRGGWSTPILVDSSARQELILNGEYGVHGYNPETGQEYWFCKGFSGRGTPSPVFGRGWLFVVSSKPGDTFALRPGGSGDVTETHMVWHTPRRGGRNLASPVLVEDWLLTVDMNGTTICYEASTGRELWKERLPGSYTASPLAFRGLVYLLNEAGETRVIKPGSKLNIVAHNKLDPSEDEIFRSCLVPAEDRILCRSDRALYLISGRPVD